MFTDSPVNHEDAEPQPSWKLFSDEYLEKMPAQQVPMCLLNAATLESFDGKSFLKKNPSFDINLGIFEKKKTRGRKPRKEPSKNIYDKDITIKEIIEDQKQGIPTADEVKKKEEKIKKMKEGRKKKVAELGGSTTTVPALEASKESLEQQNLALALNPLSFGYGQGNGPKIVIRDGKAVFEEAVEVFKPNNALMEVKQSNKLNSMSFRTRQHTEKWTPEENRKFYKALEIFGSDFSLISKLFKNRTRNQIKNKFHKEEKVDSSKVDAALKRNRKFSFKSISEKINALNTAMIDEYGKRPDAKSSTESGSETQLERFDKFDRNHSASSVDSMDQTIINEIKDIFNAEIDIMKNRRNPQNALMFQSLANLPDTKKSLDPSIDQISFH
jgi:hypothetical protein